MKKFYLLFLLPALFCSGYTYAVTINVVVANNTFTPANFSTNVGDVIQWTWSAGTHTTSSTSVPAGASNWNANINSGLPTFSYMITTAGNYSYQCNIHGASMSGSFTAAALPLELRSFTGKTTGSSNWLYWETLTERNVQSHIVERSADGQTWVEAGRRPGMVNATVPTKYELEDQHPFHQTYYRLRSVDLDGRMSISKAILLGEQFSITSIFPNPAVDQVTVQFTDMSEETLGLSVVDITGKLVWYQVVQTKPGLNTTVVPFRQLSTGAYDLILSNNRKVTASLRVMKE